MNRNIPMINTARMTLSGMRPEDFERFVEIWTDPDVVRFIGGEAKTRGEAWDAFLRNAGHWQMTGFGQWAVVLQSTRQMVGQAGFFFKDRALGEDFDVYPEAGWVLLPEAQGQGLGYEAVQAAHDWFDRVIPGVLVAVVDTRNQPSVKLARKLGYSSLRTTEYLGSEVELFRRNGPPARS